MRAGGATALMHVIIALMHVLVHGQRRCVIINIHYFKMADRNTFVL